MASNFTTTLPVGQLAGKAKLDRVTLLLSQLQHDLDKSILATSDKDALLDELKIYGRDPQNADPIFTNSGIETLSKYALDRKSLSTSRNALRCLSNAFLLRPSTRRVFIDLGYAEGTCGIFSNDNRDDEFLAGRILFLASHEPNISLENLITEHGLAKSMHDNLQRHAEALRTEKVSTNPMAEMALTESLRLFFNVTHFCPSRRQDFSVAVPSLVSLINSKKIASKTPLDGCWAQLVTCFMNLELDDDIKAKAALFPAKDSKAFVAKLISLLDSSVAVYNENQMDQQVSPLLGTITNLYRIAPGGVQLFMRQRMLPGDDDRKDVLGKSATLPSMLLKMSTSPLAPQCRELVSELLFEMSARDPKSFVANVGYGYASGYLFSHNIAVPESAMNGAQESTAGLDAFINPITGQRLDTEKPIDAPEMSRAEKEREAEKLMVLFERLKKNGIIDVENPMQKAVAEGRFEELDSDAESD